MGTETSITTEYPAIHCILVKLNNPLIGTETRSHCWNDQRPRSFRVKLNNPLMGTETYLIPFCNHFRSS